MTGAIFLAVLVFGWMLWRRRAGRRQAEAQERIASVVAPLPPKGPYPKPVRGAHRLGAPGDLVVRRVCLWCGRITPGLGSPTESTWWLVDVCGACAVDRVAL